MPKKKNNSPKSNVFSLDKLIRNLVLINLIRQKEALEKKHEETCEMAARSILHALDLKDHYTFGHSTRVAYYCLVIGKEMKFSKDELYKLELGALFHDIGKIGIPDTVLLKPNRLDEDEFLIMKNHPVKSAEILEGFTDFEDIATYARHHHERYDGKGYPSQLKGEDIPLFSRIILIADTFDAMTSDRPYRKGLSHEFAFRELQEFSGTQFDPQLVKHFIRGMRKEDKKNEKIFHLNIVPGDFEKKAA